MLSEIGRVVAVEADGVWVETMRRSTCGACALQSGCGHGLLSRLGSGGRHYVRVLANDPAAAGVALDDRVRIAIPPRIIVRGSALVYLLPLVCMLALAGGLSLALPGYPGDMIATLGAVLGFGLGIALVRLHAWRHRDDAGMQPRLLGRVHSGESPAVAASGPA